MHYFIFFSLMGLDKCLIFVSFAMTIYMGGECSSPLPMGVWRGRQRGLIQHKSPPKLIFLSKNGKQTVFFILLFDGVDSYLIVVLFSISGECSSPVPMGVGEVGIEGVKMAQKSSYMGFFSNIRLQVGSLQPKSLSSCQTQN